MVPEEMWVLQALLDPEDQQDLQDYQVQLVHWGHRVLLELEDLLAMQDSQVR